jgi:ABC-type antimicrobial peptide transport system permease subunit
MKKTSSSIIYILLLSIALLAIFDTQVLSVFRRQKEIGTYVALGMTRSQVVGIFTVEGSMYSVFAIIISGIIGIPLFAFLAKTGISFPTNSQDVGFAMAETIYPIFGIKLILGSILLVMVSATIVSFLPTRKITKMNPVDALKGKLQ